MAECVFCKIVKKEIPSAIVYEDEKHIAFMDIAPVAEGHTLIVPKKHHVNLSDTPAKDIGSLMELTPKIGKAILKATGAPAFKLVINNGKEAGQIIDHVHVHIVPFFSKNANVHIRSHPKGEDLKAMAEKIKKEI